ncbi:HAD family hydrolase [Pseudogracilibacillus auburnensis]|uniref:HAD family hydrolase n=1 Tax=Pseudogracilibacillus auburnensis TaxID=1494959 RepID=UPI001F61230A|nr:HAD-IA family hydrolase [Pseudogracilibacillus auburnensis]
MIKAVIFDFDGTIIDTETAWFDIYRDLLKAEYQYDLALEDFIKVVGTTNGTLFDHIDQSLESPIDRKLFKQQSLALFQEIKEQLTPREGFLDILENIKRNSDVKLAIASSSRRAWIVDFLDMHGLLEDFPVIFSADDVEKVKPDPALYTKTVEALGVEPDEVIAVEDSANGSLAAIRAGIHCLIIPNEVTKSSLFHEKTQVIDSFDQFDLVHYLKKDTWITS